MTEGDTINDVYNLSGTNTDEIKKKIQQDDSDEDNSN